MQSLEWVGLNEKAKHPSEQQIELKGMKQHGVADNISEISLQQVDSQRVSLTSPKAMKKHQNMQH